MAAGELQAFNPPERKSPGMRAFALSLIVFAVAMAALILSPMLLRRIYPGGSGYTVIGDVGQAYGAASALVAGLALFVVMASVFVQYRQLKAMQIQAVAETNEELVLLAMENPAYRQCWGARVSPPGVGEDLYYYCGKVIKVWTRSWELGIIDESQARAYLKNFFDSELPRQYWEAHGDWHRRGQSPRSHRPRFRDLINEEFLVAKRIGPPQRRYEDFRATNDLFPEMNRARASSRATSESDPGGPD
jgi:hypothetical protein